MKQNYNYFNNYQMEQIRLGLKSKLDISIYAKPEFNSGQMKQIRYGLEQGLDVSKYAKPEFDEYQMNEIRLGLKKDKELFSYKLKLDNSEINQIKRFLDNKQDISLYVSVYTKPEFNWRQMKEILSGLVRLGLKTKLDVSIYAKPEFNEDQMKEIRLGLEAKLDVSIYTNLI